MYILNTLTIAGVCGASTPLGVSTEKKQIQVTVKVDKGENQVWAVFQECRECSGNNGVMDCCSRQP